MSRLPKDTTNWMPLGDVFYRRHSLYYLAFDSIHSINLANFKVIPNFYGGSILLTADPSKSSSTSGDVWIYSASGMFISIIKSIAKSAIHTFLTLAEDIVTVTYDGKVTIYDLFGHFKKEILFDQEIRSSGIKDCKHYASSCGSVGLALLTNNNQFYILEDVYMNNIIKLSYSNLTSSPSAWCVISSDEATTTILVAKSEPPGNTILLLSRHLNIPVTLDFSSTLSSSSTSVSSPSSGLPNNQGNCGKIHQVTSSVLSNKVALLTDSGLLWIGCLVGNSFFKQLAEYNTKTKTKASQFVWAGDEAVVALWKDILVAIGNDSSFFNFKVDLPVVLAQELDGIRIITNNSHELLQCIPKVVIETEKVASMTAGANLLEAGRQFLDRTQKADMYLRILNDRKQMEEAVSQCISSAGHKYSPSDQKALLETAHLGKVFTSYTSLSSPEFERGRRDEFVNMCKVLRVLNSIRNQKIGYPMTYEQYRALGLNGLISRLIHRKFYATATSIANFMKVPPMLGSCKILRAWAYEKVTETDLDDDVVASKIYSKLGPTPEISYSDIAGKAISCGFSKLAIRLLDYEIKSSSQVKLLLTLEEYTTAIEKSIISGDQHLLMAILATIHRKYSKEKFQFELRTNPIALVSYKVIALRKGHFEELRRLLNMENSYALEGLQWLDEFYRICRDAPYTTVVGTTQSLPTLKSSLECFKKAKYDFGISAIESQMKLFNLQQRVKAKRNVDLVGCSLNDTLKKLIILKFETFIAEIKKECKVSEKRFWSAKVTACAESGDWIELDKLCRSKKSPIGYEPFVDACIKAKNNSLAFEYAKKIVDHESKIRYMVQIGYLEDAAQVAFENRDSMALDLILSRSSPGQKSRIIYLKEKISSNALRGGRR